MRKMHYVVWRTYSGINPEGKKIRRKHLGYLCNGACYITKSKSTRDKAKVTCKNCLRKLER